MLFFQIKTIVFQKYINHFYLYRKAKILQIASTGDFLNGEECSARKKNAN